MMKSRMFGAMLASMVALTPSMMSQAAPVPQVIVSKKQRRGLFNGKAYAAQATYGSKGAGITMAQQKRTAKKSRNVKRHRSACRA